MECKLPELVVFLQDSNHQVFKDICMEGEQCSLENCELNHHNIYYMLKYELDNSAELENRVSESYEGIVKQFDDSKNLLMEGKSDTEIADAISYSHDVPKQPSLDREFVDQKENQDQELKLVSMMSKFVSKEVSCNKSSISDSISREASAQNTKAENNTSTENGTPRNLASLFADQNTEKFPDREDMNLVVIATKQCHDNISIRSSSTNSTKSFAFPILTSEWPGSPVKMVAADKREFKRRSCHWKTCFGCCKF
ncbi:uncharacterized protein LOC125859837 [Solanum stenotomum]|uniref:uncharacterized protein LOC125859837 n=1 Tax=Solanum stenotomum TaxID=172797 RepID=UPI0020D09E8C|nr:uncharacterized protein LOC125859837 [Solanum stenotomum]